MLQARRFLLCKYSRFLCPHPEKMHILSTNFKLAKFIIIWYQKAYNHLSVKYVIYKKKKWGYFERKGNFCKMMCEIM